MSRWRPCSLVAAAEMDHDYYGDVEIHDHWAPDHSAHDAHNHRCSVTNQTEVDRRDD
jgi:hypothetical protein